MLLKRMVDEYAGKVAVFHRHYPLSFHAEARGAAEAAEAAGEQGLFWEMHDVLFNNSAALSAAKLRSYAQQLGLDMARYDEALSSGRPKALVDIDIAEGNRIGLSWTPYVIVNGELLDTMTNPNLGGYAGLKAYLDSKIK